MVKKIPLTQGKFALVDDADFDWLNQWKWRFNGGYAVRTECLGTVDGQQKTKRILMHRLIAGTPPGMKTDHIDRRDKLNNQRSNLRHATGSESQMNRGSHEGSTSIFKGVSWNSKCKKWRAKIKVNGGAQHLGSFSREDDAALAYNFAAHQHHGAFAVFNVAGG